MSENDNAIQKLKRLLSIYKGREAKANRECRDKKLEAEQYQMTRMDIEDLIDELEAEENKPCIS